MSDRIAVMQAGRVLEVGSPRKIYEQPQTLHNTMRGRVILEEGFTKLGGLNLTKEELLNIDNITITAFGTSWHSALIGEMMIEELCRIPV